MSTFFWISGIIAAVAISVPVIWWIVNQGLQIEWESKMKTLKEDRQHFDSEYKRVQQWYSQEYHRFQQKEAEFKTKEQELQALEQNLKAQIIKNNQEKEECIRHFNKHLDRNQAYVDRLAAQLANARQRGKRLAKKAEKTV